MSETQTQVLNHSLFFLSALFPGFIWMGYFFYKAQIDRSHIRLLGAIFIMGMVPVIPAGLVEEGLITLLQSRFQLDTMLYHFVMVFFIVGPVEEFVKFYVVFRWVYRYHGFDEPMDGIVYGSASALGFASLENLFYMLEHGWSVILLRGPLSTLGHVLFASYWGVALGSAYFQADGQKHLTLIKGLLLAIFMHGLFNFLILAFPLLALLLLLPLMVFMWRHLHREIDAVKGFKPFIQQVYHTANTTYDFHNRDDKH